MMIGLKGGGGIKILKHDVSLALLLNGKYKINLNNQ